LRTTQDVWTPLLAIAGFAIPYWTERAERAAVALSSEDVKAREESLGVKLLLATREAFEAVGDPAALATNYLRLRVGADEHSAFYDWKGTGKPISAKAMAAILSGYGIDPEPRGDGVQVTRDR
jgi:hypothetical protein